MENYDDIINLHRPISKHPQMSLYQRSAQFAPFAALKIQIINEMLSNKPEIEVTYFIPDGKKDGGRYEK